MRLTADERNALVIWLGDQIQGFEISQHGAYNPSLGLQELSEDLSKKLQKIADRGGIRTLLQNVLTRYVAESAPEGLPSDWCNITQVAGFHDSLKIAKELVQAITKHPKDYIVFLRGPQALAEATKGIEIDLPLTDRFGLVSSGILKRKHSLINENEYLTKFIWRNNNIQNKAFAEKYLYFYFHCRCGVISPFNSRYFGEFLNEVRAFYGACLAHGVLAPYVDSSSDITPLVLAIEKEENSISNVCSSDSDVQSATYFMGGDFLQQRYLKQERFLSSLSNVIDFFKCNDPKLKTAAMWLLRARRSSRELDQVLESAIALEVLLGDRSVSDKVGLTRLMANRCAYAVGKSSDERGRIQKFFEEFYSLRSEIVHTGKFDGTDENQHLVWGGTDLAQRLLVHEQKMASCIETDAEF